MEFDEVMSESDSYRSTQSKELSFKQLVIMQVQRVVLVGSKEFKAGFFVYDRPLGQTGQPIKYFGDTRKEYLQSIDALCDLLLPKFDKKMREYFANFNKTFDSKVELVKAELRKQKDATIDNLWEYKIKIYRKHFQKLLEFIEENNWFEAVGRGE